jgi:hypothetical protein
VLSNIYLDGLDWQMASFRIIGALVAWLIAAHLPTELESQGEKLTKIVR